MFEVGGFYDARHFNKAEESIPALVAFAFDFAYGRGNACHAMADQILDAYVSDGPFVTRACHLRDLLSRVSFVVNLMLRFWCLGQGHGEEEFFGV